jgi:hypothetical protein
MSGYPLQRQPKEHLPIISKHLLKPKPNPKPRPLNPIVLKQGRRRGRKHFGHLQGGKPGLLFLVQVRARVEQDAEHLEPLVQQAVGEGKVVAVGPVGVCALVEQVLQDAASGEGHCEGQCGVLGEGAEGGGQVGALLGTALDLGQVVLHDRPLQPVAQAEPLQVGHRAGPGEEGRLLAVALEQELVLGKGSDRRPDSQ